MELKEFKQSLIEQRSQVEFQLIQGLLCNRDYSSQSFERLVTNKTLSKIAGMLYTCATKDGTHSESFIRERIVSLYGSEAASTEAVVDYMFCKSYSVEDLESFADTLKDIVAKFRLMSVSKSIAQRIASGDSVKDVCTLGTEINDIANTLSSSQGGDSISVGDAMDEMITNLTKARKDGVPLGVPYHIKRLCKALVGMFPSDLVLFAARPSVGKTAFALNLASKADEATYGIFSTEMSEDQLCKRFISMETGIDGGRMRDPSQMTDEQFNDVCRAAAKFKGRNIHINDKGGITVEEIKSEIEYWVKVHGVNVILVDYLQRVKTEDKLEDVHRIGHIARTLKESAKEYGVCIIALAQLNRDLAREARRPIVSDLRGSGEMEQEADSIVLMHKPSLGTDAANAPHVIELIVAKNRHGMVGICPVMFDPTYMNYYDLSDAELQLYQESLAA